MSAGRSVLLVAHTARPQICAEATRAARRLAAAGFRVRMLTEESANVPVAGVEAVSGPAAAESAEIVLTLGGDGTFLRAAELARPAGVPMLGVNLGHVGFLAGAEPQTLDATVQAVIDRVYEVEERVTVDAEVFLAGRRQASAWALNEVSIERVNRTRMLELSVAVDGRPLLRFGCDGILCATPTGSTAYAFSLGGPIVWPNVDALMLVPNAAHALFSRPVVVAPSSIVDIELVSPGLDAVVSCDGRRSIPLASGARLRVRRSGVPVKVARVPGWNFTERLVQKFQLPVRSLREVSAPLATDGAPGDSDGHSRAAGNPWPSESGDSPAPGANPTFDADPGPDTA